MLRCYLPSQLRMHFKLPVSTRDIALIAIDAPVDRAVDAIGAISLGRSVANILIIPESLETLGVRGSHSVAEFPLALVRLVTIFEFELLKHSTFKLKELSDVLGVRHVKTTVEKVADKGIVKTMHGWKATIRHGEFALILILVVDALILILLVDAATEAFEFATVAQCLNMSPLTINVQLSLVVNVCLLHMVISKASLVARLVTRKCHTSMDRGDGKEGNGKESNNLHDDGLVFSL